MSQRLVRIFVHTEHAEAVRAMIAATEPPWQLEWAEPSGAACFDVMLDADRVEALLDPLDSLCANKQPFRVLVLEVESTLPRIKPPADGAEQKRFGIAGDRVSREELYQRVARGVHITPGFIVATILATVVAAIGLSRDLPAVVIGAMVIAPLLGPNMALGLATTLGDGALAWRALRANLIGVSIAFALSLAIGALFPIDLLRHEIVSRTQPDEVDLVLALAAGVAGAMAITSTFAASLVGVMVAVALLPPLVVVGMQLPAGEGHAALGAALLLLGNVLCVNLAAVVTFRVVGIRPRTWWESERANRAAHAVLWTLAGASLTLAAVLVFMRTQVWGQAQ